MADAEEDRARFAQLVAAGAVGASVAHELRNALAVAESSLYLAERSLDDRQTLEKHLQKTGAEIRKAQTVIGSVMGLARGDPAHPEPVEIARLWEAARQSVVLPTNVTFQLMVEPRDLIVQCDPVLMERVFSNLLLNAIDALRGRGRGSIRARVFREGSQTWMTVQDDGNGIEPDVCQKLFEPLVTSKPEGTGLGLTLCWAIVRAHGGEISAASTVGQGTTFRLWLP